MTMKNLLDISSNGEGLTVEFKKSREYDNGTGFIQDLPFF
jgi:hypothetical protein